MKYQLILMPRAELHLKEWMRSGQKKTLKKIYELFKELESHPYEGTGQVEQLKGENPPVWSRRIDKKSHLLYSVIDDKLIVNIISLKGHYDDK